MVGRWELALYSEIGFTKYQKSLTFLHGMMIDMYRESNHVSFEKMACPLQKKVPIPLYWNHWI